MSFGILSTGLNIKTLADIKTEKEEKLRTLFGNQINLEPSSVFGQLVSSSSERESSIWELIEALYAAQHASTAEGISFDYILALIGLVRLDAQQSIITGQALFGVATTVIPALTGFSVLGDPTARFQTIEDVTLGTGTDEVQDITFDAMPTSGSFKLVFGDEITIAIEWDDTLTELQDALNALDGLSEVVVTGSYAAGFTITFQGEDGKQEHTILVEDSNVLLDGATPVVISIVETTPGIYQAQVGCLAVNTGPLPVAIKALSVIDNPVSGLTKTFNPEAALIGRDLETDAEGKIRRTKNLQISSAGTVNGIRKAILDLNDDTTKATITSALVYENVTSVVDVRGMPGKSIGAWVYQENAGVTRDQEIAEAIFIAKSGGIETFGAISKTVLDSQGFAHTVKLSRPTPVDIYLDLVLTVNSDYPADGNSQVELAIIEWGNSIGVGQDVIVYPSLMSILNTIPGIIDVSIDIGTTPSPSGDSNVDIDDGTGGDVEFSNWEVSNITVAS